MLHLNLSKWIPSFVTKCYFSQKFDLFHISNVYFSQNSPPASKVRKQNKKKGGEGASIFVLFVSFSFYVF